MKRLFIFGVCVLVVLCMASCYPEGPDYVHEKDIALTHYDEESGFFYFKNIRYSGFCRVCTGRF